MRVSKLFQRTQREEPGEAALASHKLLLKAGMIHQIAAGIYSYLPLGFRALKKIEKVVREEMEGIGGQEILMPALQPLELWRETGRDLAFGKTLFVLRDRRDRELCLGPTHEEIIARLSSSLIRSYRDLPLLVFQIQTKFRDEPRARGGLVRLREFLMKDLYSMHADEESLSETYEEVIRAYERIYRRCGLEALLVEADSGAIGGKESHEFMVRSEGGEDEVVLCPSCGYAANVEKALFRKPSLPEEPLLPLEEVETPGVKTIEDLARFLGISEDRTLKAVFYWADGEVVLVAIRGDLEVNEVKLKNLLGCRELRLADEEEVAKAGLVPGSASPIGIKGLKKVADDSILLAKNLAAGANKPGWHFRNANYPRDYEVDLVGDIARADRGSPCARCGAPLELWRAIEVGHLFKLGTIFSEKFGAYYLDREGRKRPVVMGCYGLGLDRLLAAIIEQNHDEKGIIWPLEIAPFQIYLCPLGMDDPEIRRKAEELYMLLGRAGFEVLYDDREESPGVKFNDADLLGIPVRLVISKRTLKTGSVEVKRRDQEQGELVPQDEIAEFLSRLLASPAT